MSHAGRQDGDRRAERGRDRDPRPGSTLPEEALSDEQVDEVAAGEGGYVVTSIEHSARLGANSGGESSHAELDSHDWLTHLDQSI